MQRPTNAKTICIPPPVDVGFFGVTVMRSAFALVLSLGTDGATGQIATASSFGKVAIVQVMSVCCMLLGRRPIR